MCKKSMRATTLDLSALNFSVTCNAVCSMYGVCWCGLHEESHIQYLCKDLGKERSARFLLVELDQGTISEVIGQRSSPQM